MGVRERIQFRHTPNVGRRAPGIMALSDMEVRRAKPAEKPYKLGDQGGLFLLVKPTGSKTWRFKYRYAGKERLLTFGPYPLVSLLEAREKLLAAKKLLLTHTDPASQKQKEKAAAIARSRNTFGLIAQEQLQLYAEKGLAEATMDKHRWALNDLAAVLSNRPIADITAAEVLDLLRKIERTGRRETAKKLRGDISAVFRLAIVTGRAESDPTTPLRGALLPPKRQHHPAITDEAEFGKFLRAFDEFNGWPTVKAALMFQILTMTRPGETRGAKRDEFDCAKAVWRIPEDRMKMRRPHDVPLSRQAVALLDDIWPYSEKAELVFPSIRSKQQQLSENAFNAALRRMGYSQEEATAHGFRATASSILNSRGYVPDVIEAALAHQDPNAVRRAYNRATYWDERVALMQHWADIVDDLRSPSHGGRTGW